MIYRLLILTTALSIAGLSSADELYQDFSELADGNYVGEYPLSGGWYIADAGVNAGLGPGVFLDAVAYFLGTNGHVRTPFLTNGVGTIDMTLSTFGGNGSHAYAVESSPNSVDWTTLGTFTNVATTPTPISIPINHYTPGHIRIRALPSGPNTLLEVAEVQLYDPPAKVDITNVAIDPVAPGAGDPVSVTATLTPSPQVSNLSAQLDWWTPGSATNTIGMTNVSGNIWAAADTIDGQEGGVSVFFTIRATFDGPYNLSPATANSSYRPAAATFASAYKTMSITGTDGADMLLIDNHSWQGIANSSGGSYRFEGVTTNTPPTTNLWGDSSQSISTIPFEQTAAIGESPFNVDTLPAGQVLMRLNETNATYLVNSAIFQNYDGWGGAATIGDHDLGEWQVRNGYVNDPGLDLKLRGQACTLQSSGYARSASLPDGVGEISFWFRNGTTGGAPLTAFSIQVSPTGGSDPTEWTTVGGVSSISSILYNRYSLLLNTRYHSYVRVLVTGTATLVMDELLVAHAGSGLTMENLTIDPPVPSANDPINVSVDILSQDGASVSQATLYYRTAGDSIYESAPMTTINGTTYETSQPIPPGQGDNSGGSGTVEFYVGCSFTGFQADAASPTLYPENGNLSPASFDISPAQVTISNVTVSPETVYVGTPAHIEADIIPRFGAFDLAATLYHRTGDSGPFTAISMTNDLNHFITTSPLPVQSIPGARVEYYIEASFSGADPLSPTNAPTEGAGAPYFYIARLGAFDANFETMRVEGDLSAPMTLVADHVWQYVSNLTEPTGIDLRFVGQTNAQITTYGDDDQDITTLPAYGIADSDGLDIAVNDPIAGPVLIRFNETNRHYTVKRCTEQTFTGWPPSAQTFGNHSHEGWQLQDGRIETDLTNAIAGDYAILNNSDTEEWISSADISGGLGDISFWYRNVDEKGTLPGSLRVERYNPFSGWDTLATLDAILSADWLYASVPLSDPYSTKIRIISDAGSNKPQLAVDELIIAETGPTVSFTNLTHTPEAPSITDAVVVSVDIEALSKATNLTAELWYRIGTNGSFQAIPMSGSGGTFTNDWAIPRSQPGTAQYYVSCHFEDPLGQALETREPLDRLGIPAEYEISDEAAEQETFETWEKTTYPTHAFSTNGWTVTDANIGFAENSYIILIGAPFSGEDFTNSTIYAPYLPNGVGSVTVNASAFDNGNLPYMDLFVETSEDGTNWSTVSTIRVTDHSSFGNFVFGDYVANVDIYHGTYLRLRSPVTAEGTWVLVNDVFISYPPAYVGARDFLFAPGYPAQSDPVYVSCVITSATTFLPASGIIGQLYYRDDPGGPWSGPLPMENDGDIYTSTAPVPAVPAGTTIEYYVHATFNGYYYQNSLSPMSFPDPGTPNHYDVRRHRSFFSRVSADTSDSTVEMSQSGDYEWELIVNYPTNTPNAAFNLITHDIYNGERIVPGVHTNWGDALQERFDIPLGGTLQAGAPPIAAVGPLRNQYVLRINELSLNYAIQRCLFQNYEGWAANYDLFDASLTGLTLESVSEDFNNTTDWPPNATYSRIEYFGSNTFSDVQPFPFTGEFTGAFVPGLDADWGLVNSVIVTQVVGEAVMLDNQPGFGYVRHALGFQSTDGPESLTFDVRASDNLGIGDLPYPTYNSVVSTVPNIMAEGTFFIHELPANAMPAEDKEKSFGYSEASMIIRRINDSNYYEFALRQNYDKINHEWDRDLVLLCVKNGTRTPVWTKAYNDQLTTTPHVYRVTLDNYNGTRLYYQVYEDGISLANGATATASHLLATVQGGTIGFTSMDAGITVDKVTAGAARIMRFQDWPNIGSWATLTRDDWTIYDCQINSARAILRNYDKTGTRPMAYVRSPIMKHGIGSMAINIVRNSGGSTFGTLLLQYSTDPAAADSEWKTFASFPVDGNEGTKWLNAEVDTPNVYFRAACSNASANASADIRIDDITLQPNRDLAYVEEFETSASGWSNANSAWSVTNGVYRRPAYNGPALTLNLEVVGWDDTVGPESAWPWQTITNLSITHGAYKRYTLPIEMGDNLVLRAYHPSGNGNLILDNFIDVNGWRGKSVSNDGWATTESWFIQTSQGGIENTCELLRSRAATGKAQHIQSPILPSLGSLSFDLRTEGGPATFRIDQASADDTNFWYNILPETTVESDSWIPWSFAFDDPASSMIRIIHTSTAPETALYIDNIDATEFVELNDETWRSYNALITSGQPGRTPIEPENQRAGFINNNPTNDTTQAFLEEPAYIESAILSNGVGEISFWYRSWDGEPTTIRILTATNRLANGSTWTELDRIENITSTTYQRYKVPYFEPEMRFVRLAAADATGLDRSCTDNILITAPLGASFSIRKLTLDPPAPTINDSVDVSCETYDYVLNPSNIVMTLFWRTTTNNWGVETGAQSLPMTITSNGINSVWYGTQAGIPPQPVDTVVQYWVKAEFDGVFSENSSPRIFKQFTPPEHHYPVNLNTNQTSTTPYYFSFSCRPGQVWINEINIVDSYNPVSMGQFVELCGVQGTDIGKWKLQAWDFDELDNMRELITIPPATTLPNSTNRFGFYVIGDDTTVPNVNQPSATEWFYAGGFRLIRSVGTLEQAICYDGDDGGDGMTMTNHPTHRFVYIGILDTLDGNTNGLHMTGTGSNMTDFVWVDHANGWTPGAINTGQTLIAWPDGPIGPGDSVVMEIKTVTVLPTQVEMIVESDTSDLVLTPMVTTNLLDWSSWVTADNPSIVTNGTSYTVTCDRVTTDKGAFYMVTTPAPPPQP